MHLLNEAAARFGTRLRVLLRRSGGNQFGMDDETLCHLLGMRERFPGLCITGFQQYTGTQKRPGQILREIETETFQDLYLLADACRAYAPERVIIEYDPAYWISKDSFNRNARYQLDVMAFSAVKLRYFQDLCLEGDLRYVLMPWFLYADSFDRIAQTVAIKRSEDYRTYSVRPFAHDGQRCEENGFTPIPDSAQGDHTIPELSFDEENERYTKANQAYFEKTLKLCAEKGIEVVVVTTPVPAPTLEADHAFYSS